ncbi:MAG: PEGA domain-containing protein [Candidatus Giovannonibacteria bacterium]|nr:PEGA domain-containing protein [Candidatus Giovannonibacteria bacterium]
MLTKTKRRVLFYLAIIIFLLLLAPVILYSLGYGIGSDFSIHKTGGIFIKASEAGAKVAIDKKNKNTSLLANSALIKNLLPGKYQVSVEKDGFWKWAKTLAVLPEMVAERNVLLVPKNAETKILGAAAPALEIKKPQLPGVKKFWIIPKTDDFLILGDDEKFYKNKDFFDVAGQWGTTTFNALKSKKNSFFDENFLRIIYWDEENIDSYWISDLDKMPEWEKSKNLYILSASPIRDVRFYPNWQDYLLVASGDSIYVVEMERAGGQNIFPIYKGKAPKIISAESGQLILLDGKNYIEVALPK